MMAGEGGEYFGMSHTFISGMTNSAFSTDSNSDVIVDNFTDSIDSNR